jgi:hypothetical protein
MDENFHNLLVDGWKNKTKGFTSWKTMGMANHKLEND